MSLRCLLAMCLGFGCASSFGAELIENVFDCVPVERSGPKEWVAGVSERDTIQSALFGGYTENRYTYFFLAIDEAGGRATPCIVFFNLNANRLHGIYRRIESVQLGVAFCKNEDEIRGEIEGVSRVHDSRMTMVTRTEGHLLEVETLVRESRRAFLLIRTHSRYSITGYYRNAGSIDRDIIRIIKQRIDWKIPQSFDFDLREEFRTGGEIPSTEPLVHLFENDVVSAP